MSRFRWWLFKRLSVVGWWICPEPHKTTLQAHMPSWQEIASLSNTLAGIDNEEREE